MKVPLEISQQCGQLSRSFRCAKERIACKDAIHLLEIIAVVRAKINYSGGSEGPKCELREPLVDEPVAAMFSLWPGIGKVDVQGFHRVQGKQMFDEIRRFDSDAAQICQLRAARFALHFANAAEQALDANEV